MVSVGAKYGSGGRRPGLRRDSACGLRAMATSNEWIHRSSLIGMGSRASVIVQRGRVA